MLTSRAQTCNVADVTPRKRTCKPLSKEMHTNMYTSGNTHRPGLPSHLSRNVFTAQLGSRIACKINMQPDIQTHGGNLLKGMHASIHGDGTTNRHVKKCTQICVQLDTQILMPAVSATTGSKKCMQNMQMAPLAIMSRNAHKYVHN